MPTVMSVNLVLDAEPAAQAAYEAFHARNVGEAAAWDDLPDHSKAVWRRVAAAPLSHIAVQGVE